MSITPRPPIPSFLPETAPFTPEQRAWLNGLFAGLFGLEGGVTPLSKQDVAKLLPGLVDAPDEAPEEVDDGAPWHDPAMPLPDRMKLADGKPLPRRMMAAMAQQDCGQCGYNCKDYADALFEQKGKAAEPVRAGRQGHRPHAQAALSGAGDRRAQSRRRAGGSRAGAARRARPLARQSGHRHASSRAAVSTKRAREKETWHIEFDLAECGLDYEVGDSFGVFPANDAELGRRGDRRARCAAGFPHRRPHIARGADRRRLAVAGARHAVPAHFLLTGGERRQESARRWPKAAIPTAMPRRSTCWPPCRNSPASGPIRKPSSKRSIPCSRASIRSRRRLKANPGPRLAHGRCGALSGGQAHAARRRLDLPRRPRRARRQDQGLCAEGAAFRAAGRSEQADHHDRAGHRHRAVPRLPAGAHGDQGAGAQLAVFRPSAQRLRFLLRGRAQGRCARAGHAARA